MDIADSNRLCFRMITEKDVQLLFQLDQDPEVMRYINGGTATTMQAIEEVYLPRLNAYRNPDTGWGLWHVALKSTQQFLGWILIRPMNFFNNQPNEQPELDNLEIGWRFFQEFWGNGHCTEAAQAIMQGIQDQNQVRAFSAIALTENRASIQVMKKLGMQFVKTYLHEDPLMDSPEECVYYQLAY